MGLISEIHIFSIFHPFVDKKDLNPKNTAITCDAINHNIAKRQDLIPKF